MCWEAGVELEVLEVLKPRLKSGAHGLQCAEQMLVFFCSAVKSISNSGGALFRIAFFVN